MSTLKILAYLEQILEHAAGSGESDNVAGLTRQVLVAIWIHVFLKLKSIVFQVSHRFSRISSFDAMRSKSILVMCLFSPLSILVLIFSLYWHPSLWVIFTICLAVCICMSMRINACISVTQQSIVPPILCALVSVECGAWSGQAINCTLNLTWGDV